jgi:hypothetical protein
MLHACLYTICFVFCYTSWRFYAFSGTNLLTRCHSVSSLFSVVSVFQKSYTRIILRIGRNKSWSHQVMGPPGPPPDAAILLGKEDLKTRPIFHEIYCKPLLPSTRDQEGPEALPSTLPERGITTGGLLHHHACLRSDVWAVYLGLRAHSSS